MAFYNILRDDLRYCLSIKSSLGRPNLTLIKGC